MKSKIKIKVLPDMKAVWNAFSEAKLYKGLYYV